MAEKPEQASSAPEPAGEVESLTNQILAKWPNLDAEALRQNIRGLREAAAALDAVALANGDEPASTYAAYREED